VAGDILRNLPFLHWSAMSKLSAKLKEEIVALVPPTSVRSIPTPLRAPSRRC
jgi:hypothetical protein